MLLGPFSRSLVLPLDVYPERTEATILNGILTIRIPIRAEQHRLRVRALDIPLKPLKLNILSMPLRFMRALNASKMDLFF